MEFKTKNNQANIMKEPKEKKTKSVCYLTTKYLPYIYSCNTVAFPIHESYDDTLQLKMTSLTRFIIIDYWMVGECVQFLCTS